MVYLDELPEEIIHYIASFIPIVCKDEFSYIPSCISKYISVCGEHFYVSKTFPRISICSLPYTHDATLYNKIIYIADCIQNKRIYSSKSLGLESIHFRKPVTEKHIPYIKRFFKSANIKFSHFCCSGNGLMFSMNDLF